MGGKISAQSTPGEGAKFTIEVPLTRAAGQPAADPAPTPAKPAAAGPEIGARVLLAEDHPTNRKVVELILTSVGVDLTCVENGAEAVKIAAEQPFDLILMDMQMPVMDGLTATRLIREREAIEGLDPMPILCLTANALPEHVDASRAAGADAHLTKPISAVTLIAAVREAVARKPQKAGLKKAG
jgi:CheY-like chemotaxis protein